MNVTAGDIARIVGDPGNEMALLKVLRPITEADKHYHDLVKPAWICEALSTIVGHNRDAVPGDIVRAADRCLRRLHDGDGVDEIVARVGKPDSAAIEWALRAGGGSAA